MTDEVVSASGRSNGETFMGFNVEGNPMQGQVNDDGVAELWKNDLLKNVLVLGSTGAGKTVGVALPALHQFVEKNMPGLVSDVKGELCRAIDHCWGLDDDRFFWISPHEQAESINLISGFSAQEFGDFIGSVSNVNNKSDNKVFTEKGIDIVKFVFRAIEIIEDRKPTITEIYDAVKKPEDFGDYVRDDIEGQNRLDSSYQYLIDELKMLEHGGGGFHILKKSSYFEPETDERAAYHKQFAYAQQSVLPYLGKFNGDRSIEDSICAENSVDFKDIVYRQNKIIVLDLPSTSNETTAMAQKLIRARFQNTVRTVKSNDQSTVDGEGTQTFTLADDFQQIVSFDDYLDDNHWLDVCRGLDHGVLALTQSINSIKAEAPGVNSFQVRTFLQNCRTKIFLESSDPDTIRYARYLANDGTAGQGGSNDENALFQSGFEQPAGFFGGAKQHHDQSEDQPDDNDPKRSIKNRLLHPESKGEGLLYQGTAQFQDQSSFMGLIKTGETPGHDYMGEFIHMEFTDRDLQSTSREDVQKSIFKDERIENPYDEAKFDELHRQAGNGSPRGGRNRRSRRKRNGGNKQKSRGSNQSDTENDPGKPGSDRSREAAADEQDGFGQSSGTDLDDGQNARLILAFENFVQLCLDGETEHESTMQWLQGIRSALTEDRHPDDSRKIADKLEEVIERHSQDNKF